MALVVFVDSQVAIHLGDGQRALQDILALYGLANHVDAVPGVISHLVGIAVRRQALLAVQGCIEIDLLQDDQLQKVDEMIQDYCEIGDSWRTVISEELALSLPAFTNPSVALKSNTPIPARGHDAVYFIGLMRQAMQLDTRNWSEFSSAAQNLDVKVDDSLGSFLESIDRLLSHVFAPAFGAMATLWIGDAQLHRQARLAIAIRGYAHRFDQLPNTLDDLPDASVKLHPFGNKPFGYERQQDQAVLWGFDVTSGVRRTPTSPPTVEAGTPGGIDNYRFVWHIHCNAK